MAKFKLSGSAKKRKQTSGVRGALPCLVIIIGIMVLLYLLFVAVLKQS
jgi:hypothetical protein